MRNYQKPKIWLFISQLYDCSNGRLRNIGYIISSYDISYIVYASIYTSRKSTKFDKAKKIFDDEFAE